MGGSGGAERRREAPQPAGSREAIAATEIAEWPRTLEKAQTLGAFEAIQAMRSK